jgi:predicted peptidase
MRPMAESIIQSFLDNARRRKDLGLGYLSLDRASSTLSTGERQRVQLARAVRNETTGVLYVLDEPSIGLHPSNIEGLMEVVNSLIEDGIVDENRIYLSGLSMGGGLSWEYAARYPDMFAGIVTFSTRGTIAEALDNMDRLEDIKTIPCWLFHAAGDIVNPTLNSLDLYKGMTALGNENAHLSIYDALDAEMQGLFIHFSWVAGLNTTSMMDWMFEQSRA